MTTTETKTRTITMTDRPPVTIRDNEWPVIAKGSGDSFAGNDFGRYQQSLNQGEIDEYSIRVRQHVDGRAIVYAIFSGAWAWTGHDDCRGGEIVPAGSDIVAAIRRVGEDCGIPDSVIRECIADLPAEEI